MTYDPFQTYPAFGQYSGIKNPIGLPYTALQNSLMNPAAALSPFATQGGINPQQLQQLQLASILAAQGAIPQLLGLSPLTMGLHNQLVAALHNPLAGLQNPQLNPTLGGLGLSAGQQLGYQPNSIYGQIGSPYGQAGSPFGQQFSSPYGQVGQTGSPFPQQTGSPFGQTGFPLAPQSWVGQPGPFGGAQAFGQSNSILSQLIARPFQAPGISPWGY